jgi:hypothetical protein
MQTTRHVKGRKQSCPSEVAECHQQRPSYVPPVSEFVAQAVSWRTGHSLCTPVLAAAAAAVVLLFFFFGHQCQAREAARGDVDESEGDLRLSSFE